MPPQVIEHWTFSLFFCIAELWGAVVISVLFWTLANDVCTVADAKIIYPSLGRRLDAQGTGRQLRSASHVLLSVVAQ
jgi:ATP/ADP translocase